jgi:hypothetical protein
VKALILLVLGLAAAMPVTFGQGYIVFNSEDSHNGDGVQATYGTGVAGHPVGTTLFSEMTAGLLYSTSPIVEAATVNSLDASSPLNGAWSVAPNIAYYYGGFYRGNNFILADGVEGQVVYFEVIAFQTGASGSDSAERYMNSTVRGHSASFTGVLRSFENPPNYMNNLQPFSVFTVPEPSTLTLGALGLAALVVYRCKHA